MRRISVLLVLMGLLYVWVAPAWAQTGELRISISRTMGYSQGNQLQGSFSISASGPQNLQSVTFQIDGQPLGTVAQAPFRLSFQTGDYAAGQHTFSATAQTADGQTLRAQPATVTFLNAAQAGQATARFAFPLLGAVAAILLLSVGLQMFLTSRRGIGSYELPDSYGAAGGAICPKCGWPFRRGAFSMNLVTGKLERCPHCGKWAIVRAASREQLAAAADAVRAASRPAVPELSAEEKLRQQIEQSKYT